MQPLGSPAIGMSATSVWDYGPKIAHVRPTVADGPKYLEDVKYTSSDIAKMTHDAYLPTYTHSALSPRIAKPSAEFHYAPPQVAIPQTVVPSMTQMMVNKARAIKAYQG